MQRAIDETPAVARLMRGARREWPVRVEKDFSYGAKRYAGDRWLLAGDAGSFLDPVFSTGVAIALESGVEAGRAICDAVTRDQFKVERFHTFSRRQRNRYKAFRRFVVGFYSRNFRDLFFQPDPPKPLFNAIVRLLAGYWDPPLGSRILLEAFYASVWTQKRFQIADPVPGVGSAPRPAEAGAQRSVTRSAARRLATQKQKSPIPSPPCPPLPFPCEEHGERGIGEAAMFPIFPVGQCRVGSSATTAATPLR